ncbi:MAG: hypothetical protein Kapaf2KO_06880 [Candidatus Kapaibacteriales bacterium]
MKVVYTLLALMLLGGCQGADRSSNAGSPDIFYTYINLDESLQPLVFEDTYHGQAKSNAIAYSEFQNVDFESANVNLDVVGSRIQTINGVGAVHSSESTHSFIGRNFDQTFIALGFAEDIIRIYDNYPAHQSGKGWIRVLNCDTSIDNMIVLVNNTDTLYTGLQNIINMNMSSRDFLLVNAGTLNFKFINGSSNEIINIFPSIELKERDKTTIYLYSHSNLGTRSGIIIE